MESDHPPASQGDLHGQITLFPGVTPGATPGATLRRAAQAWIRRGYAIVYEDDHLVELAKEDTAPGRWIFALAVAGAAVAGLSVVGATLIWLRARPWRIVSLAASPEHKVIAHGYRSRVAPDALES
jgi:hypothetical protein